MKTSFAPPARFAHAVAVVAAAAGLLLVAASPSHAADRYDSLYCAKMPTHGDRGHTSADDTVGLRFQVQFEVRSYKGRAERITQFDHRGSAEIGGYHDRDKHQQWFNYNDPHVCFHVGEAERQLNEFIQSEIASPDGYRFPLRTWGRITNMRLQLSDRNGGCPWMKPWDIEQGKKMVFEVYRRVDPLKPFNCKKLRIGIDSAYQATMNRHEQEKGAGKKLDPNDFYQGDDSVNWDRIIRKQSVGAYRPRDIWFRWDRIDWMGIWH